MTQQISPEPGPHHPVLVHPHHRGRDHLLFAGLHVSDVTANRDTLCTSLARARFELSFDVCPRLLVPAVDMATKDQCWHGWQLRAIPVWWSYWPRALPHEGGVTWPDPMLGPRFSTVNPLSPMHRDERNSAMNHFTFLRALPLALVVIITCALPMGAHNSTDPQVEDARVRDARRYGADQGLEVDEAGRRLQLQALAGQLEAELRSNEPGRFGGLWLEHQPQFRVVVALTDGGIEAIQPYIPSAALADVAEVHPVSAAVTQLKGVQVATLRTAAELGLPVASAIDYPRNRVRLYVRDRVQLDETMARAGQRLSDLVEVAEVGTLPAPVTDIYGGLPLDPKCTAGFAVGRASGERGISSAGHCPNDLNYSGAPLPFWGEGVSGSDDVQWHHSPAGYTPTNLVSDDLSVRRINSTTDWNYQPVGGYVCKYGKATGFTCGYIVEKDIAPWWVSNPNPDFIRVEDGSERLCWENDSGGPVYNGYSAYGIISGYWSYAGTNKTDCIYGAVDSFYRFGLWILTYP
jgi:hypothetical protein